MIWLNPLLRAEHKGRKTGLGGSSAGIASAIRAQLDTASDEATMSGLATLPEDGPNMKPTHSHQHDTPAEGVTRDPVCGMAVNPQSGKHVAEHDGHTYHFCSESCRERFVADPDAYRTPRIRSVA